MKKSKNEVGITLIALTITIIVLLILAGVTIAALSGDNGILLQAINASAEQSHGSVRDGIVLAYNEYQIEVNTVSNTSFLDFLSKKGYASIDEEESISGIINVEALIGSKQALGNGTDIDVYKIEEDNGLYIVNYYDENNQKEEIWSIVNNDNEEDNSKYRIEFIDEWNNYIGLKDLETNEFINFGEAYIVFNGKTIDISDAITEDIIGEFFVTRMSCVDISKIVFKVASGFDCGTYEIIIVKDGEAYSEELYLWWVK